MPDWSSITELAEMMVARARARKRVVLSSETAYIVGLRLMTVDARPTRDAVAGMICDSKCTKLCIPCICKANVIVNAYGRGVGE